MATPGMPPSVTGGASGAQGGAAETSGNMFGAIDFNLGGNKNSYAMYIAIAVGGLVVWRLLKK